MPMSSYFSEIRGLIGSRLILVPAACVFVRDSEGRLLLVRHRNTGLWGTVGGAIDPGESPRSAAERECLEETGLKVQVARLLGVVGGGEYEVTYPNGDQVGYVSAIFSASLEGGEARPDGDEVIELGWFHDEELESLELNQFSRSLFAELGDSIRLTA
jgi:8-oxo-dGTP pyrophosphatase MutT (NUDIX family)